MTKALSLPLLMATFSSCNYQFVYKHVKQNFTYCYDGVDTGLDTMLNIDGYYDFVPNDSPDSHFRTMFYKDGTYVSCYNFHSSNHTSIENIHNHPEALYWFHKNNEWGRYTISGDTIKAQAIECHIWDKPSNVYFFEVWYKIIDTNTIVGIYPPLSPIRYPVDFKEKNYRRRFCVPAKFTPVPERPSSDCFLKKRKWFWCNENEWKAYKRKIEKNQWLNSFKF
jgi:hypothetical protein